jgi:xanthine dehydrogenase YagT iron-sulfur-binding subunit
LLQNDFARVGSAAERWVWLPASGLEQETSKRKATMSDQVTKPDSSGVSRRGFLKGISVGTVATGLLSTSGLQEAAAKEGELIGPEELEITLNVNGQNRKVKVEPRVTLLDALRNRLDLTGCKKVCDRGTCGACTVLVDGNPAYSCSLLAIEAMGRKITTVEGLGTPDKLNAVQAAFIEHDAQQCGFCTPGFVVACSAFVREHPNATIEEVRSGLGGNLCRCGTYAGMMLAVADAAKKKGGV